MKVNFSTFVNDALITVRDVEVMENLLERLKDLRKEYGLFLNEDKTVFLK